MPGNCWIYFRFYLATGSVAQRAVQVNMYLRCGGGFWENLVFCSSSRLGGSDRTGSAGRECRRLSLSHPSVGLGIKAHVEVHINMHLHGCAIGVLIRQLHHLASFNKSHLTQAKIEVRFPLFGVCRTELPRQSSGPNWNDSGNRVFCFFERAGYGAFH